MSPVPANCLYKTCSHSVESLAVPSASAGITDCPSSLHLQSWRWWQSELPPLAAPGNPPALGQRWHEVRPGTGGSPADRPAAASPGWSGPIAGVHSLKWTGSQDDTGETGKEWRLRNTKRIKWWTEPRDYTACLLSLHRSLWNPPVSAR